ncbi:MAG: hypothetical protein ACK5P6_02710 [Pseudobdellovibrionaceae bacterium]
MVWFRVFVVCCLFPGFTFASLQFGTGANSATGGRLVPSLNLGLGTDRIMFLASSTGVATESYYHSNYTLSMYWKRNAGEIGWGPVTTGFGVGSLYAKRGFQDSATTEIEKSDWVLGPAFYSQWNFLGGFYLSVEGIYGIIGPSSRNFDLAGLNARDHVNFILGFSL